MIIYQQIRIPRLIPGRILGAQFHSRDNFLVGRSVVFNNVFVVLVVCCPQACLTLVGATGRKGSHILECRRVLPARADSHSRSVKCCQLVSDLGRFVRHVAISYSWRPLSKRAGHARDFAHHPDIALKVERKFLFLGPPGGLPCGPTIPLIP
jgi:hypothetical protein